MNGDIIQNLIEEFSKNREALLVMVSDLEKIKEKIDTLIPTSLDNRNLRYFQMKVEAVVSLYDTMLDIRKEIGKLLKDELDIRKNENPLDTPDISEIADRLEKLMLKKEKVSGIVSLGELMS